MVLKISHGHATVLINSGLRTRPDDMTYCYGTFFLCCDPEAIHTSPWHTRSRRSRQSSRTGIGMRDRPNAHPRITPRLLLFAFSDVQLAFRPRHDPHLGPRSGTMTAFAGRSPLLLPLSDDSVTNERPPPREQRPEWLRFARLGGFLRYSIRGVIAWIIPIP